MKYAVINETGRANLIAWCAENARQVFYAKEIADYLIGKFDGSFPNERALYVELRGTRSGNPEFYYFGDAEIDIEEIED